VAAASAADHVVAALGESRRPSGYDNETRFVVEPGTIDVYAGDSSGSTSRTRSP
jgi:hypothetical protein